MRFIGGGLAPYAAGRLADHYDLSVPFYVGAAAFVVAIAVLASGHRLLEQAERGQTEGETVLPRLEPVGVAPSHASRPVLVAVGSTADASDVVSAAAEIARDAGTWVEVVHVRETAVVEELAIEPEDEQEARERLLGHLDRLAATGVPASGLVLHSVGDHAAAGRVLARHADERGARLVAVGSSPRGAAAQLADGSLTSALTRSVHGPVVLLRPGAPARELTVHSLR